MCSTSVTGGLYSGTRCGGQLIRLLNSYLAELLKLHEEMLNAKHQVSVLTHSHELGTVGSHGEDPTLGMSLEGTSRGRGEREDHLATTNAGGTERDQRRRENHSPPSMSNPKDGKGTHLDLTLGGGETQGEEEKALEKAEKTHYVTSCMKVLSRSLSFVPNSKKSVL